MEWLSLTILWIMICVGLDEESCPLDEQQLRRSCCGATKAQREHECGNKKPPSDCCARVSVDGFQYRFVQTEDTSQFDCVSNCIYERPDIVDSPYFCFAHGKEDMLCEDELRGCEISVFNSASALGMTWDEGKTSISVIDADISFKCEIMFVFSFKKGIKLGEIHFCCSRSEDENQEQIETLGKHNFQISSREGIILDCSVGVAFTMGSLSDDILKKTLKCSNSEDNECVTTDGEVFPHLCQFPFMYKGKSFEGCTDFDSIDQERLWCATSVDKKGEMVAGQWGHCSQSCVYGEGTEEEREQRGFIKTPRRASGYDCILNPQLKMDGSDVSPLLPPSMKLLLPKKSNYLGESSGQHKFKIGNQQVNVSCPGNKFYDPKLEGHDTVLASCGPTKDTFTIQDGEGDDLATGLKSTQFGCDPCPLTTKFIPGYLSKTQLEKTEVYSEIQTISECSKICSRPCVCGDCKTFIYSKERHRCEILSDVVTKTTKKSYKDFVICSKSSKVSNDGCRSSTADETSTDSSMDSCCDSFKVEYTGGKQANQPSTLGTYMREGTNLGKPVYKKEMNLLFYSKQKTWVVSASLSSSPLIETREIPTSKCPDEHVNWGFYSKKTKKWIVDRETKVTCSDLCGVDISVDRDRYLADLNTEFIFSLLNTQKLEMFKVAEFRQEKKITNHQQKYRKDPGLYSLVLAPRTAKCDPKMFQDATRNKNKYFPVYVGKNIPNDILRIFEAKAKDLKSFFPGERLQLCGTYQPMTSQVLKSTLKIMTSVFKFTLNDKTLSLSKSRTKLCSPPLSTVKSLSKTSLKFDTSDEVKICQLLMDLVQMASSKNTYQDFFICDECGNNNRKRGQGGSCPSEPPDNPHAKPQTIKIPGRKSKTIAEWEISLESYLIQEKQSENTGFMQNLILTYTRYEMRKPTLDDQDYKTVYTDWNDELTMHAYEEDPRKCKMQTFKSCDITATALSMTFLEDVQRWAMEDRVDQMNDMEEADPEKIVYIPWKDGLEFVEKQIKLNFIIKIELNIWSNLNHLFVMWKTSDNKIGIVHGWHNLFYAKVVYHDNWETAFKIFKTIMEPVATVSQDWNSQAHKDRIRNLLTAFKSFFGMSLDNTGLDNYWEKPENVKSENIFQFKEIFSGFPSDMISSAENICRTSEVYRKNKQSMRKTKDFCEKLLSSLDKCTQNIRDVG